jgi:NAD(P)-dependent dehydrogenase (short-subunit alcohol dehydrogenase family)
MRALITGASRGIGRAVAEALSARGAQLALAGREPASVRDLPGAIALPVELRSAAELDSLVPRAVAALGGVDVLVNCAGIARYTELAQVSRAELLEQLDVNFVAPFVLSQAAALHMGATGGGVIINVASTLGLSPVAQTAAYAASKAALLSLTRSLALEFAPRKVRANAIAAGLVDTDMIRAPRAAGRSPEQQVAQLGELPLLKRLGTPQEIAQAALFLIDSPYITGATLLIDGGLSLA